MFAPSYHALDFYIFMPYPLPDLSFQQPDLDLGADLKWTLSPQTNFI